MSMLEFDPEADRAPAVKPADTPIYAVSPYAPLSGGSTPASHEPALPGPSYSSYTVHQAIAAAHGGSPTPEAASGLQESIGNRATAAASAPLIGGHRRPSVPEVAPPEAPSRPIMGGHRGAPVPEVAPSAVPTVPAAPALGDRSPAPIKLPEKYKDEQKKVGWRAFHGARPDESPEMVARRQAYSERTHVASHHYSDEERAAGELTTKRGDAGATLTGAGGDPASFGSRLYAMSPEGRIVTHRRRSGADDASDDQLQTPEGQRNVHHSALFSGGDVAHAGHIGTTAGKVSSLDDDSGHYRPDAAHTWDAFSRMRDQGVVDMDKASSRVSLVDKTKTKGVDADYAASSLQLPFFSYNQTQGNERQARNKSAMLAQLQRGGALKAPPASAASPAAADGRPTLDRGGERGRADAAHATSASRAAQMRAEAMAARAASAPPVVPSSAPPAPSGSAAASYSPYTPYKVTHLPDEAPPVAPAHPGPGPAASESGGLYHLTEHPDPAASSGPAPVPPSSGALGPSYTQYSMPEIHPDPSAPPRTGEAPEVESEG